MGSCQLRQLVSACFGVKFTLVRLDVQLLDVQAHQLFSLSQDILSIEQMRERWN